MVRLANNERYFHVEAANRSSCSTTHYRGWCRAIIKHLLAKGVITAEGLSNKQQDALATHFWLLSPPPPEQRPVAQSANAMALYTPYSVEKAVHDVVQPPSHAIGAFGHPCLRQTRPRGTCPSGGVTSRRGLRAWRRSSPLCLRARRGITADIMRAGVSMVDCISGLGAGYDVRRSSASDQGRARTA